MGDGRSADDYLLDTVRGTLRLAQTGRRRMGDDGLPDAVPGLRPHPEVGRKMNLEWWKHTNLRGPTVDPAAAMKEMRRKVAAVAAEVGKPTDGAAPPPAAAAPAAAEEGGVPPRGDLANAIRAMGRDLQDQAELALLGPRVAASAATLVEAAGEVLPGGGPSAGGGEGDDPEQWSAIRTLCELAQGGDDCAAAVACAGGAVPIAAALHALPRTCVELAREGVNALACIAAAGPAAAEAVGGVGVVEALVTTMDTFGKGSHDVAERGCRALSGIARGSKAGAAAVAQVAGVLAAVAAVLQSHPHDDRVGFAAADAICGIARQCGAAGAAQGMAQVAAPVVATLRRTSADGGLAGCRLQRAAIAALGRIAESGATEALAAVGRQEAVAAIGAVLRHCSQRWDKEGCRSTLLEAAGLLRTIAKLMGGGDCARAVVSAAAPSIVAAMRAAASRRHPEAASLLMRWLRDLGGMGGAACTEDIVAAGGVDAIMLLAAGQVADPARCLSALVCLAGGDRAMAHAVVSAAGGRGALARVMAEAADATSNLASIDQLCDDAEAHASITRTLIEGDERDEARRARKAAAKARKPAARGRRR